MEAENYTDASGAPQKGNANNIVYLDGWTNEGASAKWEIWAPKAGNYRLHFKIASESAVGGVTAGCGKDADADMTELTIQAGKDLNDYQECDLDVTLEQGENVLQFDAGKADGDFRLDCIVFEYLD